MTVAGAGGVEAAASGLDAVGAAVWLASSGVSGVGSANCSEVAAPETLSPVLDIDAPPVGCDGGVEGVDRPVRTVAPAEASDGKTAEDAFEAMPVGDPAVGPKDWGVVAAAACPWAVIGVTDRSVVLGTVGVTFAAADVTASGPVVTAAWSGDAVFAAAVAGVVVAEAGPAVAVSSGAVSGSATGRLTGAGASSAWVGDVWTGGAGVETTDVEALEVGVDPLAPVCEARAEGCAATGMADAPVSRDNTVAEASGVAETAELVAAAPLWLGTPGPLSFAAGVADGSALAVADAVGAAASVPSRLSKLSSASLETGARTPATGVVGRRAWEAIRAAAALIVTWRSNRRAS